MLIQDDLDDKINKEKKEKLKKIADEEIDVSAILEVTINNINY